MKCGYKDVITPLGVLIHRYNFIAKFSSLNSSANEK